MQVALVIVVVVVVVAAVVVVVLVLAYIVVVIVVAALLLPQRQANFDTMPQLLMALTSQVPVAADVVLTVLLLLPQSCCQH